MKYISVCSGIEAATVAWHPLGWEPVAFAEIEKFSSAVLAHRFPNVPNLGDMTKFQSWDSYAIDLLVGGTPCQAFSIAGLRKGLDDPRGNLTLAFLALARRFRPRWVVWENVPGVLNDRTNAFGLFLAGLAKLGYGCAYRVFDAQFFGVPQRRNRVFVVGYFGAWQRAASVLLEPEGLRGDSPPRRASRENPAPCLSARASGGGGLGTDFDLDGGLIAHTLKAEGFDASEDGTGRGTPIIPVIAPTLDRGAGRSGDRLFAVSGGLIETREDQIAGTLQAGGKSAGSATQQDAESGLLIPCGSADDPEHIARTLTASPKGYRLDHESDTLIAFSSKDHGGDADHISPTLRAMGHAGSHANAGGQVAVASKYGVRRLTPRECERLQGFPDDWTLVPFRGKPAADGPRYKSIGNSMAVPCMRWIGRRISILEKSLPA